MADIPFTSHARYFYPGILFSENSSTELDSRDPQEALENAPSGAFCFELYDLPVVMDEGDEFYEVKPIEQNVSGRYYLGGEIFKVEELEALGEREGQDYSILQSNMNRYDTDEVIRCVPGNWQPFMPEDTLLNG